MSEPVGGSSASRSGRFWAALVAALGTVGGALLVQRRARREPARDVVLPGPHADVARRLGVALDAGRMGTWSWDLHSNAVDWDDSLERVFGIEPGTFEKTFDAWQQLLHPDDRTRALETIEVAMKEGGQFRFDHRTIWPDGSVHWIEGRGEAVFDQRGEVIGAVGVAIDIDDRRRAEVERMALYTSERQARRSAERSMAALTRLQEVTFGVSGATTVDEIARVILDRGMAALGAVTGYFATLDHEKQTLVLRAQVGYDDPLIDRYRFVDLSADLPAPAVLRTGEAMFVESPDDGVARYPAFPRDEIHGAYVVCPLLISGVPSAAIALGFDEPRTFGGDERAFIAAVVEACAQALQRALLFEAERESRDRLRLLLEASEQLSALDEPDALLEVAARFASRIGSWGSVLIVDEHGGLRRAAAVHRDPSKQQLLEHVLSLGLDRGEVTRRVVTTRQPVLLPEHVDEASDRIAADRELSALIARLGWRSGVAVPMIAGGRCIGAMSIGDDRPLPLGTTELEVAFDLARRTASAYERARLLRVQHEHSVSLLRESQERLEAETRIVALLQSTVLPEQLPEFRGVEIAAAYEPAESGIDVGGDWYDAFTVAEGGMVVVIGDVAGHGVEAASLMGRVRNAARAFAIEDPDPARILRRLDHMLRTLEGDAMVTAIAAHIDSTRRTLSWSRAGHPPPLLYTGGDAQFLEDAGGTPLGSMMNDYVHATRHVPDGGLFLLYTDGLVERRAHSIDEGLDWLAARVARSCDDDLDALCRALIRERFGNTPSEDDICVLALRARSD